ncbi:hypothetical protein AU255_01825 [Methyloprofundus sedimenti]|uniref:Uncharacterized protein n=1 Tax=Methyloprofundus sedimenti TaxID=1420851 RepID=A0A1V8M528_9GAMM|nr:hypothetical protein [Methyloprofundus sedimenti]OQK16670.1 hypothetical protein AU255_01825 [Methyloprofundus sedimenti]
MLEVKIQDVTENIAVPAPLGTQENQLHIYPRLYFVESGQAVPDNIYTLKQGQREEMCDITAGQIRGIGWVDKNQPIYIVLK